MLLKSFFNPKSLAVVGVSENSEKLGSVVFKNIIDGGYKENLYAVNPKSVGKKIFHKQCYASVRNLPQSIDLVVIVVPAKFVNSVINDCVFNKVKNVSIITAGFSEIGNHELERNIYAKCFKAKINILGPNCLGHISTFSHLNASFADGFPNKGNIAFISQSGAFCSAMMDWTQEKTIGFSHFISIGNKLDLSEVELLNVLKDDPHTKGFVFYLESLKDGQEFLKIIRKVSKVKPIVILHPGKSKKAQAASLSHTGSLAPNYRILEMAFEKAGAIQVHSTREMFVLVEVLQYAKHKEFDGTLAVVTNAGGFGVLISDLCEDYNLKLAEPSKKIIEKLKKVLPVEAALGNPIDVVGDAGSDRYEKALETLCQSKEYKNILVLLTPQRVTDVKGTAEIIVKIDKKYPDVNVFASFIGGTRIRKGVEFLRKNKSVCFNYPIDAAKILGLLKKHAENRGRKEVNIKIERVPLSIKKAISKAKEQKLSSLLQEDVDKIMKHYKIDFPKSANFINKKKCLEFCKEIFPKFVVLKLSAPDALHKKEMKGVCLNVDTEAKFEKAWDGLWKSIKDFRLKKASVFVQEQISDAVEVIAGVSTDDNFGEIMLFGSGGSYAEIFKDTTIRVLPTNEFKQMLDETKIGIILNGVRGEKPRAVASLVKTLKQIQKLVLEIPEIKSIDANPILVTNKRSVVVDLKLILK